MAVYLVAHIWSTLGNFLDFFFYLYLKKYIALKKQKVIIYTSQIYLLIAKNINYVVIKLGLKYGLKLLL